MQSAIQYKPYTFRLDELFVRQGMSTFRSVRRLLQAKNVTVNGQRVTEASFPLNTMTDSVAIDGTPFPIRPDVYIMMNKPQDTVCTSDEGWHHRVFELVDQSLLHPQNLGQLHAAGRLDLDTEGLLLLTTDGKLSHYITSPQTHIPKTYLVYLRNQCSPQEREQYAKEFKDGIFLPPQKKSAAFTAKSAELTWIDESQNPYCTLIGADFTVCTLKITEGKFHQVKRMFEAVGNEVIFLKRIAMGSLFLDSKLLPGQYRFLNEEELKLLFLDGI